MKMPKKKTMPAPVPMSTPAPPSMPPQAATTMAPPASNKHNPDNMLSAGAFHKPGAR